MEENTTTNVETTEETVTTNTKKKVGTKSIIAGILAGTAIGVVCAKKIFKKVKDKKAASNETTETEG